MLALRWDVAGDPQQEDIFAIGIIALWLSAPIKRAHASDGQPPNILREPSIS